MLILLAGILFLLLGIAGYILQTVRLKDMEEAKYFFMILMGLSLQFIVVVWNLVRNSANFYFEQGDIILTVFCRILLAYVSTVSSSLELHKTPSSAS